MSQKLSELRIAIVGLGLIGGSIARGLKSSNASQSIQAVDLSQDEVLQALEAGAIDGGSATLAPCGEADLIVLATPPLILPRLLPAVLENAAENAVITDVASVKGIVLQALSDMPESFRRRFIPGHPIAGSEKSGFAASRAELFRHRNVILTPLAENDIDAVALVHEFWRSLGALVIGMSIERHDQVLAATSHLPHLLAYSVVDVLESQALGEEIFRYAAGGFADFSRLASSDPLMWSDICIANAKDLESILDVYIEYLVQMKSHLNQKNHAELHSRFCHVKTVRDAFIANYSANSKSHENGRSLDFVSHPCQSLSGEIRVPGDKSISHRSIIFGALADGVTSVEGFLEGEDALNTVAAFREMGVTIVGPENGALRIYGVGIDGLQEPRVPLYMGNSGTAMRLMSGLLAAQSFASELTGDESLSGRPMDRVANPLRKMGADIVTADGGTPPLRITGKSLHGIDYAMPMASAQVKSCLLLAGLYAQGQTRITEPGICRDHTERMLQGFSYPLHQNLDRGEVLIKGGERLTATTIDVPADISSAAFFIVAAAITPGSDILLRHVGINPTRIGILNLMQLMGADITLLNESTVGGEPVADIRVRASQLSGIEVPSDQVPLAIDEFPVFLVAAACAQGVTWLRDAEELRVKESDRLAAMATGLTVLGIENEPFADGIKVVGGDLSGGRVDSFGDHRIAMAFTVAALRASAPIHVENCANVATSFPGFVDLANSCGFEIQIADQAPR